MNGNTSKNDRVNHPSYYQLENGVEIIDIIRYYTCDIANAMKYISRAGLKGEEGMTLRQKEVEDCRKAIFYLLDYMHNAAKGHRTTVISLPAHPSGVDCETVASCYCVDIASAFRHLWWVGLVVDGVLIRPKGEMVKVYRAIKCIERHLDNLSDDENG